MKVDCLLEKRDEWREECGSLAMFPRTIQMHKMYKVLNNIKAEQSDMNIIVEKLRTKKRT